MERAIKLAASSTTHFVALRQEIRLIAAACFKNGEGMPVTNIRAAHGQATTILEILARIEASPEKIDFTQLLHNPGIEVPVQSRIEVITPLLKEEQQEFLRRVKEKGCTVEIFLLGPDTRRQKELLAREFDVFCVKDYGNELIY